MTSNRQSESLPHHLGWASILLMGGAAGFALIVDQTSSYLSLEEGAASVVAGIGDDPSNGPERLVWSQFEERVSAARPDAVFLVDGRDGNTRYRIRVQSEFTVNDTRCWNFAMMPLAASEADSTDHVVCRSARGLTFLPWVYASG